MKLILAAICIMGLAAAAQSVARDAEPHPENVDAITTISGELESAKEAKTLVRISTDGHDWYGVPTHISNSTVSIQTGDRQLRALVRLDRITGVELTNSPDETKAAEELLKKAYGKAFPQRDAGSAGNSEAVKIKGTVTFDGKPLGGPVEVSFTKRASTSIHVTTKDDGTYEVSDGRYDGEILAGEYDVVLEWKTPAAIKNQQRTVEVETGENVFNFDTTSN